MMIDMIGPCLCPQMFIITQVWTPAGQVYELYKCFVCGRERVDIRDEVVPAHVLEQASNKRR